ncbi:MAG: hypothetical protein ACRC41_02995, partial [Sarcina sp.]
MISRLGKLILFMTSYIPLYIIFLVNNAFELGDKYYKLKVKYPHGFGIDFFIKSNMGISIITGILILILVFALILLKVMLKQVRGASVYEYISDLKKGNDKINEHIFVYIMPFIGFDSGTPKSFTVFVLIFILICFVAVKNDLVYINPTLYLLGYNVFTCKQGNNE